MPKNYRETTISKISIPLYAISLPLLKQMYSKIILVGVFLSLLLFKGVCHWAKLNSLNKENIARFMYIVEGEGGTPSNLALTSLIRLLAITLN
jgi:hypothetical protein